MRIFVHAMLCLSVICIVVLLSLAVRPGVVYGQQQMLDPCPSPFEPSTGLFVGFSTESAANRWGRGLGETRDVTIEFKTPDGKSFNPKVFKTYNTPVPEGPVRRCDSDKVAPSPFFQRPTGGFATFP